MKWLCMYIYIYIQDYMIYCCGFVYVYVYVISGWLNPSHLLVLFLLLKSFMLADWWYRCPVPVSIGCNSSFSQFQPPLFHGFISNSFLFQFQPQFSPTTRSSYSGPRFCCVFHNRPAPGMSRGGHPHIIKHEDYTHLNVAIGNGHL